MTSRIERLTAVIEAHEHEPYVIGVSDCFTFSTLCFEAVAQREAPWRARIGTYHDEASARSALKKARARDIGQFFARALGADSEIPPAYASPGDLVTHLDVSGQIAMGVCIGGSFAARGENRLIRLPMRFALRAFRV
jgi:hypothetical protein